MIDQVLEFVSFEPWVWYALGLAVLWVLISLADRYDQGRPASRALSEREAQDAVRPWPAPVDVTPAREDLR